MEMIRPKDPIDDAAIRSEGCWNLSRGRRVSTMSIGVMIAVRMILARRGGCMMTLRAREKTTPPVRPAKVKAAYLYCPPRKVVSREGSSCRKYTGYVY
jgi:hypothetical protein